MTTCVFTGESVLRERRLDLAAASTTTPAGPSPAPALVDGVATHPQVVARSLAAIIDLAATRYDRPARERVPDPIVTATGDRLRFEAFSACGTVHARLDLLAGGFADGRIGVGTANVDLGPTVRRSLDGVARGERLEISVGRGRPAAEAATRPAVMPACWIGGLAAATRAQRPLERVHALRTSAARALVAELPAAGAHGRSAWLDVLRGRAVLTQRPNESSVRVAGLHRLSALKGVLAHLRGLVVYASPGVAGPSVVEVDLPDARLAIGLTDDPHRAFGADRADADGSDGSTASDGPIPSDGSDSSDAWVVGSVLRFDPVIDATRLAAATSLRPERVREAIEALVDEGRLGWDVRERGYFHREPQGAPDALGSTQGARAADVGLVSA